MLKSVFPVFCIVLLPFAVGLGVGGIKRVYKIPHYFYEAINDATQGTSNALAISPANAICATEQVVQGILYRVYYGDEENLCKAMIWDRPWLKDKKYETVVTCETGTNQGEDLQAKALPQCQGASS